ncbi:bifunctional 2-polyprenyl-6-hydroxyphenol methylase/3-demethylubiquinol 3-O-methyltransferase UbiG [Formosa sp. L2A11]|uniref:class I SAM-dependent methyltransferase n=1 Tax=Formosa sp. L2A11 TaxID=2686363 RepID=UPI00131B905C|nr:class I SAM-dependent methyltransferase [Formosa sp. L2A11]
MKNTPLHFWNERYSQKEFIYGTKPNTFFKSELDKLKPGSILLPAEGEGRNAVYAAKKNWSVTAFDMSKSGKEKAMLLSKQNKVSIDYKVTGALEYTNNKQFDAIGMCYSHFPANIRKKANQHILRFLKQGGTLIFESFAKGQLKNTSGGPKNEAMLFSIEEIKAEFPGLEFSILEEKTIALSEGTLHIGEAQVIRFVGVKI